MRRPNPPVFKRHIGSLVGGGEIQYFRDGVMVVDLQNLTTWQNLGDNTFKEGYLLGWANSGFTETTFAYISNVTFSTARLSPTLAAASP